MGKPERDKGLRGEAEVWHKFADAGFEIKKMEGGGDNMIVLGEFVFHIETKRQERIDIHKWARQAGDEAIPGAMPLVIYRRSHEPWRIDFLLDDFLQLVKPAPLPAD